MLAQDSQAREFRENRIRMRQSWRRSMTRAEAIQKVCAHDPAAFVASLEALGLLHLETTEDKTRIAAAERLTLAFIEVLMEDRITPRNAKITRDGAFEILDVLTKSGFRITKDV